MNANTPYDIMTPLWHSNNLTIATATALGITDAQFDGFVGYHLPNMLRKDVILGSIPLTNIYHAPVEDVYEKIKQHVADLSHERFESILNKMQSRGFIHLVNGEIVKDRAMSANDGL